MQKHIFNIHDVILFMTVAECILLVIFQAILPVKNQLANRLLSLFLISIAVSSACIMVLWAFCVRAELHVYKQGFVVILVCISAYR